MIFDSKSILSSDDSDEDGSSTRGDVRSERVLARCCVLLVGFDANATQDPASRAGQPDQQIIVDFLAGDQIALQFLGAQGQRGRLFDHRPFGFGQDTADLELSFDQAAKPARSDTPAVGHSSTRNQS
jgi:hypothetical protein